LLHLAERLSVTREEALYAFMIHGLGVTPLNGTTNEGRMKGDLKVLGLGAQVLNGPEVDKLKKVVGNA
jgi:hypothetical protein